MKKRLAMATLLFLAVPIFAQQKEQDRLANSTSVLSEELQKGDLSPAILSQSVCVAVFPSVKKVAIGFGSSYGRGVMVCRKNEDTSGEWTAPVMFSLDQGSLGLQIGGTATDITLTIMKKPAAERLLNGRSKLGSESAVAAGPVGSQAGSYSPEAEVLTYSRTKGVFAGISLSGATVQPDKDANKAVYGKEMTGTEIVASAPIVPGAEPLVTLLNKTAPGRPRG